MPVNMCDNSEVGGSQRLQDATGTRCLSEEESTRSQNGYAVPLKECGESLSDLHPVPGHHPMFFRLANKTTDFMSFRYV